MAGRHLWHVDSLLADLKTQSDAGTALCSELTTVQLAQRPNAHGWSIAENLQHLATVTNVFLPTVRGALEREPGTATTGAFALGWYGRLLVWYVEPPPAIRLPAPKRLVPPPVEAGAALTNFLAGQAAMAACIEATRGLNLTGRRFGSPLAAYVRMNFLEFFCVFNGHTRRHLWQAGNVRQALAQNEVHSGHNE